MNKQLLNKNIEQGIIVLIILKEFKDEQIDLDRLVYLEYLLLHSKDSGGPESILPESPFRNIEYSIKKEAISNSLKYLCKKDLICVQYNENGIFYHSNLLTELFLESFKSEMYNELVKTAIWAKSTFGTYKTEDFKNYFKHNYKNNTDELVSLGFMGD